MSIYGEQIARIDERTEHIVKRVDSMDKKLDKLNGAVKDHHDRIIKLEERQRPLSVISTSISTGISSAVAVVTGFVMQFWQK